MQKIITVRGLVGWDGAGPIDGPPPAALVAIDMRGVYERDGVGASAANIWRRPIFDPAIPADNVRNLFEGCSRKVGPARGPPNRFSRAGSEPAIGAIHRMGAAGQSACHPRWRTRRSARCTCSRLLGVRVARAIAPCWDHGPIPLPGSPFPFRLRLLMCFPLNPGCRAARVLLRKVRRKDDDGVRHPGI